MYSWVLEIATSMRKAGFDVLAEDRTTVRCSLLTRMNELHLLSLGDVPTGLSTVVDSFRGRHLDGLVEEFGSGTATLDGFICVVGRKPGQSEIN